MYTVLYDEERRPTTYYQLHLHRFYCSVWCYWYIRKFYSSVQMQIIIHENEIGFTRLCQQVYFWLLVLVPHARVRAFE